MGIVHLGQFAPIEPVAAASTISVLRTDPLGFAHPGLRRSALLPTSVGQWELEPPSDSAPSARGTKGAGGVIIPLPLRLAQGASAAEDAQWNAAPWNDALGSGGAAKSRLNTTDGGAMGIARAGSAAFAGNVPFDSASADAYADADAAMAVDPSLDPYRRARDSTSPQTRGRPRLRGSDIAMGTETGTGTGLGALAMPLASPRAPPLRHDAYGAVDGSPGAYDLPRKRAAARPPVIESMEEPFGGAARRAAYGAASGPGVSTFGTPRLGAGSISASAPSLSGDQYDIYGDYGLLA